MPSFCWKNLLSAWKYVVLRQTTSSSMMASTCKTDGPASVSSFGAYFWRLVGLRRLKHWWNDWWRQS
jgi:hypothetical protein